MAKTNNIRTFTIHAQEVKKDKQSFIACSAKIGEKWYKIKFTKEVKDAPDTRGLYDLTIDFDDCSVERGKPYTSKNGKKGISSDIIWVRHIVGLREYSAEELAEINRNELSEIFGEE